MFPVCVEKPYSLPCVGEKRRLKLMVFSEAKPSNVAPSSASCEKQRGERGISQVSPRDLCSLKPDPAEEWAFRSFKTCDFTTARRAKKNYGWGTAEWGCTERNGRNSGAIYSSLKKWRAKVMVLTLMRLYETCLRKRTCITEPLRRSGFAGKLFFPLIFQITVLWSALEFGTSSLYRLLVRLTPKQTTEQ